MHRIWGVLVMAIFFACAANAQIARTATFENYANGTDLPGSFTDSLSGITFRNSTHPPIGGFDIDSYSSYFSGGNYLTSGIIAPGGLGSYFGFTADLPTAADSVSLDAIYHADARSEVVLQGFDSQGNLIAQEAGPPGLSQSSFSLQITSDQYNITRIQVSVGGGFSGYDNIAYTYFPEPHALFTLIPLTLPPHRRRR